MYSFVKAVCLSRSIGSQWLEVDISDILVYDIFSTYTKVYLELSNPVLTASVYVDMDILRADYSSYQGTLKQLLVFLADINLDTVPALPNTSVKFAKYSDAIRSEYKIETCIIGQVLPPMYPRLDKNDLEITRPKYLTSMQLIHDYCLVSVNGFYHMTDSDGKKAYVIDGGKSMRKAKNNHIGMLSFMDIGKLEKIKLDPTRIIPTETNGSLQDKLTFSVDQVLDNKSYILILGGYMVLPQDDVFYRTGDNSFNLNIKLLPYLERLFESSLYIDQTSLGLTTQAINAHGYNIDEVYSDDVIKKYMTMSQSFLVLVDIPRLVSNKINIRHSSSPGMFTSYQDPVYPLMVNYGRTAEYWKIQEDGVWSVSVQDSFLRNFVASWQPTSSLVNVTDQMLASKPYYHGRGFLLELAGYQI